MGLLQPHGGHGRRDGQADLTRLAQWPRRNGSALRFPWHRPAGIEETLR
jgi:hypothetical protein